MAARCWALGMFDGGAGRPRRPFDGVCLAAGPLFCLDLSLAAASIIASSFSCFSKRGSSVRQPSMRNLACHQRRSIRWSLYIDSQRSHTEAGLVESEEIG